ncbi:Kelch repeat-containing protein [Lignipirellula cremea]|uniref:Kelch motif protein n=1 Tax=Lignipirellula cremea TaxID=2528010 RepID=A0A518DUC0_9BACT|nr:kelch repeat-containing protein [Lignipirellula cremea]QDU95442.1 Kelch motif protein [Lignipirellula cremea]
MRHPLFAFGVAVLLSLSCWLACDSVTQAAEPLLPNQWKQVSSGETGPRVSPALIWSAPRQRFVLAAGQVSHAEKGPFPYDVQSWNDETSQWENDLPQGGSDWGPLTGPVEPPAFKTPYFELTDVDGNLRPWQRQARTWYMGQLAPWDQAMYTLMCGRTLRYDPVARVWQNLEPASSPAPETRTYKEGLNWSAICPDPVNRELVLFGGCGLATARGDAGTWTYSTADNRWTQQELAVQPPPRALSPMAYDPATKKIVLFGGDGLDQLFGDTWVYDCATRAWEKRTPDVSPAPRFGHALLHLPQSGKIVLLGGVGYTSSTSYQAMLYQPLPFEIWTYDIGANTWSLVKHYDEGGPTHFSTAAAVAAVDDRDRVLWWSPDAEADRYRRLPATWLCQLEVSSHDAAGEKQYGVPPETVVYRSGPYDPAWYTEDLAEPSSTDDFFAQLPTNQWTTLPAPKWPHNRQGGGWSTTAFDSDRGQILHLGGGHSSYFGNDVAHFDTATARWSISYRPQFALDFNYDLSGPGPWAFNGGPWGNHNYHAYAYDPVRRRLVFVRDENTHFYDPEKRAWSAEERLRENPFFGAKYTSYVISSPQGVIVWALRNRGSGKSGIWKLTADGWQELETSGDDLPTPITDGATMTFDEARQQLLLTTTRGESGVEHSGQVWSCDLKSGKVQKRNPAGREAIVGKRFAREAVLLPDQNLVMFGYLIQAGERAPFYDIEKNRWLAAAVPGSSFFNRPETGASVDLGLHYDQARQLVWGVLCRLKGDGDVQVLKVGSDLSLEPLGQ